MRLSCLIVLLAHSLLAHAKLSCLGWTLLNPFMGAFCYFKPEKWEAAGNATADAVHSAVNGTIFETPEAFVESSIDDLTDGVSNLLEFAVTHHPVTLATNFVTDNEEGGLNQSTTHLKSELGEEVQFSIGFGKGIVNQGVGLVNLMSAFDFQNVGVCLTVGAASIAYPRRQVSAEPHGAALGSEVPGSGATSRGAVRTPTASDVLRIGGNCFSERFRNIAAPPVFNITEQSERAGATLADIATLFIPVEPEAIAGSKVAKGAVDLAIPGEEGVTRLFKYVSEDAAAEHFANKQEALTVRKQLKDKSWTKKNCGYCPAIGAALKVRDIAHLARRGAGLSACCKVSTAQITHDAGQEASTSSSLLEASDAESVSTQYFDPFEYGLVIGEEELVAAPSFRTWGLTDSELSVGLRKDLYGLNSGIVAGPPFDPQVLPMDKAFAKFREGLSADLNNDLYRALEPDGHPMDRLNLDYRQDYRVTTSTGREWMTSSDPLVKDLQDFSHSMMAHVKKIYAQAKPHLSSLKLDRLKVGIEYHYTPPVEAARLGVDARGPHMDMSAASFIAADQPGLVVSNGLASSGAQKSFSRSPNQPNTLHFLKGLAWDASEDLANVGVTGGTVHTVFGDEIAVKGRLSMIVNVVDNPEMARLMDARELGFNALLADVGD